MCLLRFVLARLFHVLKLKLFLLPNNVLAKRINVNINTVTSSSSSCPDSSLSRRACLASASLLSCYFRLLSLPMVATTVCELDVGEDEVIWACACLCVGSPEGAKATPLHNPNPTSPNPNSKNSSDLC
jgi:hypothetical protein